MPIYEYGCTECGNRIEAFQKVSDDPLSECPDCGGELSKLISNSSFVLKGGGWYADGYGAPTEAKAKDEKPATKKESSAKKDSPAKKPSKKSATASSKAK